MNLCHGPVVQEVRPGTARVKVTEMGGSNCINPTPNPAKQREDPDSAVEHYLSPERLELLCGTQDLSLITSLEVCVDTQANTLGNFGSYLPRLVQLKMNNSLIMSVRDLGTTLSHLQVLWMSHCCLQALDGISTFSSLKELYLAFNNVSDLSQISMLDNLQLLDLEGNYVDDLAQVQYLGLCSKLQTLTLEGNPVCVCSNPTSSKEDRYSYRAEVRELIPQLRYLDDVNIEEDHLACCSITEEDWAILRNSIRKCDSSETASENGSADSVHPYNTHSSARRPFTSLAAVMPLSSPSSRLTLATGIPTPPGSRPGSSNSDLATIEAETSTLTHGAGKILFCGNPVQAIRARREQLKTAPTKSTLTPRDLPIHVPEHTYDLDEPDLGERVNLFAELRAWREQHSRYLGVLEKERSPQIMAIHHGGEDETDEDEEECFVGMRSSGSDEDQGEVTHSDRLHTGSLDSSFHYLSPDLNQHEALSPDMARLALSPDAMPYLSPPHCVTSAPTNKKLSRIRARRLRLSQASSEHLADVSRKTCVLQTTTPAAGTDLSFDRVQHLAGTNLPPLTPITQIPCPPSTRGLRGGPVNSGVDMDMSSRRKTSQIHNRPVISRPHTARAVLQKHHQHHRLQPYRGSSHLD